MKKKTILIVVCLILAFVLLVGAGASFYVMKHYGGCVTRISLDRKSDDTMNLRIRYLLPSGGYSVRNVPTDEGEYIGDGMRDYNGALGKHRIILEFGDVKPAESFLKKRDENGIFRLADGVFAKIVYPSDHGFALYIGSDSPISVETLDKGELDGIYGTVTIAVALG